MLKLTMTYPKTRKHKLISSEQGMVAIFTVLIVMGILTLLTIGFSNITRRAQQRTLESQLSTQAFYAAETGVNRAWELLNNGAVTSEKTACTNDPGSYDYSIDSSLGIEISCILIDPTPEEIRIDVVPVGDPRVFYVGTAGASPIDEFTISWDSRNDPSAQPSPDLVFNSSIPRLFNDAGWGNRIGIVRVDLIPILPSIPNTLTRQNLATNSYSFFLYPGANPGTSPSSQIENISTGTSGQGIVVGRRCQGTEFRCQATVRLSNTTSREYFVRLQSYYNETRTSLRGTDISGNEVEFSNSQAIIDVTGRVNEVSRRIQVQVPIEHELNRFPGLPSTFSLLSAGSICKRLVAIPGPGGSSIEGADGASSDPACALN